MNLHKNLNGARGIRLTRAAAAAVILILTGGTGAGLVSLPAAFAKADIPKVPPIVVKVDAVPSQSGSGSALVAVPDQADVQTGTLASPLREALRAAWLPEGAESPTTPALTCAVLDEEPPLRAEAVAGSVPGIVLVAVRSESTDPVPVRLEARLARGLWRVDASLQKDGEMPRRWRMQSLWQKESGAAAKVVTVPPGETLTLRFTETIATAVRASRAAQTHEAVGGKTYGGASVKTALARVRMALEGMPALLSKEKRDAMTQKAQTALLAASQAHVMFQNATGGTLSERVPAFDTLQEALSEVSCASLNLVPSQTVVKDDSGKEQIRLSLTNVGTKTIPLVAIGLSPDRSGGQLPTHQTIFRKVSPGKQVYALFPIQEGDPLPGAIQFNIEMGTAVVLARPIP